MTISCHDLSSRNENEPKRSNGKRQRRWRILKACRGDRTVMNGERMSKSRYRPEHMRLLNDKRWAQVKAIVDRRARGLCEWCVRDGKEYGRKTGNEKLARTGWLRDGVDHHHLIPFESAKTIDEAERLCYDPNNVVLLCVEHHRAEHNQKGYHTKPKVKEREAQRLERWKERQQRPPTANT